MFFLSKYTAWYDYRIPSHQMVFHKPLISDLHCYIYIYIYAYVDYLNACILLGSMHRVYSVYIPRRGYMYSIDEQKKWGCMFGYKAVTLHTEIWALTPCLQRIEIEAAD